MTTTITARGLDTRDLPDKEQYRLGTILGIWAASALPMGLGLWWVMPTFIAPRMETPGIGWLVLATAGLVWQAVLAFWLLRLEVRPFTWEALKRRLWLEKPRSPRTGRASWRYLWWAVAVAVGYAGLGALGLLQPLNDAVVDAFPAIAPPDYALIENLAVPEVVGQWWLMGLLVVLILGNYLVGEELIFRGILLPRMRGAFGRLDVLVNGLLFATYHLHLVWQMPAMLVTDWLYAYLTKRYRSYWMGALFHGIDAIFLLVLFPLVIAGVIQS
ncbi:CPBP family intramembrane glutamic endopeptidase [Demequina mangrovi]|uniref:CAAX protease self-immunity n=1 Tax=Demequina mangrovi TaxID=1043493 RepID=A0A1H6VVL7_9MICO|nr:CPBP family intramembrane glutamic endopeptidase [Demequina mangrovi]SEJ08701.1 CAAX protease self-immunity [Demequina mangrovi]